MPSELRKGIKITKSNRMCNKQRLIAILKRRILIIVMMMNFLGKIDDE